MNGNLEVALANMKPADKAKAFDMIAKSFANSSGEDLVADITDIFRWCENWFGE